jgi:hypothetical protein
MMPFGQLGLLSAGATMVSLSLMMGCSPRPGGDLHSVPATFSGTLKVQPQGRETKTLYEAIVKLTRNYGMDPRGDGATDGKQWQIQIFCGQQYVGGGTTARDGDLVLFDLAIYGFREPAEYERFKNEMLSLMKPVGALSSLQEHPHLDQAELLKRAKSTGFDVASRCGPP